MLGSRRGGYGVYRGPFADRMVDYFEQRGLRAWIIDLEGRSDHLWFDLIGVPTGGLFAGIDPCYHRACDRIDNVEWETFRELASAAAFAIASLAPLRPNGQ